MAWLHHELTRFHRNRELLGNVVALVIRHHRRTGALQHVRIRINAVGRGRQTGDIVGMSFDLNRHTLLGLADKAFEHLGSAVVEHRRGNGLEGHVPFRLAAGHVQRALDLLQMVVAGLRVRVQSV